MRKAETINKNKIKEELLNELAQTRIGTEHEHFKELVPVLLNSSQSVFYIVQDRKFRVVTPQLLRLTGLSRGELLGENPLILVHPDDRAMVRKNAVKMLKGERSEPYEFRFLDKDGNTKYVKEVVTSITYKGKLAALGNWIDLTESRQAEEKFSKVFRSSPDLISVNTLGHDGIFIEVNDSFTRITGYTREEVIGRTALEFGLWVRKEDNDRMVKMLMEQGRVSNQEYEFRIKSGEIRIWLFSAELINLGGEPHVICVTTDITGRKQAEEALRESEEKLRRIFESVSDSILVHDLNGNIVGLNESALHMHGYDSKKELIGQNIFKLVAKSDRANALEHHQRELAQGSSGTIEHRLLKKDGSEFDAEVVVGIIRDVSDNPVGAVTTARDITERKKMEEELRIHKDHLEELVQQRTNELASLNKQLERELAERKQIEDELLIAIHNADAASRAKSDFLARMSHEIRTPIHGVMGTLDLLHDTELGQEQRQYVNMARTSAETLLNVINDILDFSKIEAGKIELEDKEFDLRTVLEETLASMAVPAHKKGLEILLHVSRGVPMTLIGDAGRLRQVLVNLLGNAVKFTEQGEIVLRAGIEADGEKEVELHFSVKDTGIGIPKEKHELLFHPFEQVDGSMTRKHGGSGLGLSICQQLVNMLSGRIWFTSWSGEGSIFHFTAKFGKQAVSERVDSLPEIPSEMRGMPLLLIDDNATCRSILRDLLSEWGFQVTEVDNACSALKELEDAKGTSRQFRIILLDKTMPTMNGFAAAEQVLRDLALRPNLVMMLPSDSISDDFARCQELGISHYLVKPIKESELLNIMLTVLGHPKTAKKADKQATPIHPSTAAPHLHILAAEDNATSQLIAKKMLEKAGHTVQIASTGVEAIRMIKERAFDLVLMDVEMPEMNGLEATRFIRKMEQKSGQHVPIIAMTAYAMKEDRQRCLEAGMDVYLS